jgi:CheY-like chemotaxis protein
MAVILVVDDSPAQAEQIAWNLRADHHTVLVAHNWEECQRALSQTRPELILVDVNLGRGAGGDVLALQLRMFPPTSRSYIVFHSAAAEHDMAAMLKRTGANGYIHKSRTEIEFRAAILDFLAGRG